MIGYYVHHVGSGHLHRALVVARGFGEPVTGLSSLPQPAGWPGPWVRLERDDAGDRDDAGQQHTAHDRLHWVPRGDAGLRSRMAEIAAWISHVVPRALVVDVSVEVAVLARLHGVPVVTVVGPGERGDRAHGLGFDLSDALVGCWPPEATGMVRAAPPSALERLTMVGAVSRFPVTAPAPRRPGPPRVLLLAGAGGHDLSARDVERARAQTPEWEWTVLDRELGTWVADPQPLLVDADVVVTHAGQNAVAEVAASRTPAVVVPQVRPHREQQVTGETLARGGWPVAVLDAWPNDGWHDLLERTRRLDGAGWARWCDGRAPDRIVEVVRSVALPEAS